MIGRSVLQSAGMGVALGMILALAAQPTQAGPVYKANNADNLSLTTSWSGGLAPGSSDVATWDGTVTAANTTILGANLHGAGLAITNPGGAVTVNAGNTLTLGTFGIDMSAATQNLTLNNALTLSGAQTWNIASGRTLAVGGIVSGAASPVTKSGLGTLTLTGANTFNGGLIVSSGALSNNAYGALGTGTVTLGDANTGGNIVTLFHNAAGNSSATNIVVAADGDGLAQLKWSQDWWGTSGKTYNTAGDWTLTLNRMVNFQCTSAGKQIAPYVTGSGVTAGGVAVKVDGGTQVTWTAQMNASNTAVKANDFTGNVWITGNTKLQVQNRSYQNNSSPYYNGVIPDQATVIIDSGSMFQVHHGAEAVGFLSGSGTVAVGTGTAGNALTLAGNATTPTTDPFTLGTATFSGVMGTVEGGLTKNGTGTQELSGAGITYNTNTTLTNGTLTLTNTSNWNSPIALGGANSLVLQLNAPTAANPWTLGKIISGGSASAAVQKIGDGAVTLSQVNTYSGPTTINAGKLLVTGSLGAGSAVTVNALGTLGGRGAINGATTVADSPSAGIEGSLDGTNTLTLNSLGFQGSGFLAASVASPGGTFAPITVTNALTAAGANTISINLLNTSIPASGVYHIAKYGSLAGYTNFDAFKLGTFVAGNTRYYSLQQDAVNNYINLSVDSSVHPVWTGALSSEWSTELLANPKNWKLSSSGTATDFLTGDAVEFLDSPASDIVDISAADVTPGGIAFSNSTATSYTLQGWFGIAGSSGLTKTNTGTLTITNTNSFTGPVSFNGGTVVASTLASAGAPSALGAGSSLTFDGGTLQYTGGSVTANRALTLNAGGGTIQVDDVGATLRIAAALSGTGTLTKAGPGTLGLDTANGDITFNGVLAGSDGAVALYGTNNLTLGGASANTFSGDTLVYGRHIFLNKPAGVNAIAGNITIQNGNWPFHGLTINNDEQIADTSVLTFNNTNDAYDFRLNGHTETIAGIVASAAAALGRADFPIIENAGYDGSNDAGITNNGTLIVSGSGTYSFYGQLRDRNGPVGSSGVTNFVKGGTGIQEFIGSGITYTGTTKITGGVLRLDLGTGLPSNNMEINGGVLELKSPASMTRSLGAGSGQIQLTGGTSGFSAFGTPVTIKINNDAATEVQWGSDSFKPDALVLNETTATSSIAFQNPLDLNGATRKINVNAGTATVSGAIRTSTGAAGLTKGGAGTLVLSGVNTYSGPTTINAGKLYVNNSLDAASIVTVKSGAILGGQGNVGATTVEPGGGVEGGQSGVGGLTLNGLSFSGAGTANVTLAGGGYVPLAVAAGNGLIAGGGAASVAINIGGTVPGSGTYHLIQYAGAIQGGFNAFKLGTTPVGARTIYTLANNPGYIDLGVVTDSLLWTGNTSEWSANALTPPNWKLTSSGNPTNFLPGDVVAFNNTASNTTVDISNGDVTPGSVTVDNDASHPYTLQGFNGIAGGAGLFKRGEGNLAMNSANTYTGGTTFAGGLNAGSVSFAENGLGSAGPVTFATSATLQWNGHSQDISSRLVLNDGATATVDTMWNDVTFASGFGGGTSAALTKTGTGTLTLAGANTFSGGLTISSGTVKNSAYAALGTGTVTLGDANTGADDVILIHNAAGASSATNIVISAAGSGLAQIRWNQDWAGSAGHNVGTSNDLVFTLNRMVNFQCGAAGTQIVPYVTGSGVAAGDVAVKVDGGIQVTWTAAMNSTNTAVIPNDFTGNVWITGSTKLQTQNRSYQSDTSPYYNGVVPDSATVIVDAGSTWQLHHGAETVAFISGEGAVAVGTGTSGNALTLAGDAATPATSPTTLGTATFSGTFAINQSALTKSGTGTQEFSGAGITFTAGVNLDNGTLKLTNTTGWGSAITLGAVNRVALQLNAAGAFDAWTLGQVISGGSASAGIEKQGDGMVTLGGANTYLGANTITAGTLKLGNATALGDPDNSLTVSDGTLDLGDNSPTVGKLSGTAGAITNSGIGAAILTSSFDTDRSIFAGAIANGSGTVGLTKLGTGTLVLTGVANDYQGGTIVSGGTLEIANAGALPAGAGLTIGAPGMAGTAAAQASAVPEPGTLVLLAAGLAGLLAAAMRRNRVR